MVSVLNTQLPDQKKIRQALTQFTGVGRFLANQICDQLGLSQHLRLKDLSPSQMDQLTRILSQYYYIELDLKRLLQHDLNHLVKVGCYRGFRHTLKLPARGQRTHTNARTARTNNRLKKTS
jgi:small subunit ribosomal protein S13